MRGWKKIFQANGNQKKTRVAILTSDKIDFKIKTITRDKEGHYIMIQEEDITIGKKKYKTKIRRMSQNLGEKDHWKEELIWKS